VKVLNGQRRLTELKRLDRSHVGLIKGHNSRVASSIVRQVRAACRHISRNHRFSFANPVVSLRVRGAPGCYLALYRLCFAIRTLPGGGGGSGVLVALFVRAETSRDGVSR